MNHVPVDAASDLQPYANAPVLVTGGAGFIGSHLVERLVEAGAVVTVVDNLQAGSWGNLGTVRNSIAAGAGDVRDAAAVARQVEAVAPHYIFHLAANASVPGSVADPAYDFEANCAGTFVLLNALRAVPDCRRVVLASSGAVYGEPVAFPIEESAALAPISPYGASKLCAEAQARMFHTVYGVPVTIARLFNTYGPRMARFVVLDFLKKLQRDPSRLEILGSGRQVRDFTYVADTVAGLLRLGLSGAGGEAYNISSGATHSVTELAHQLIQALGLEGQTAITYSGQSWVGDAQHWEVAVGKIAALGYRSEVTLTEGLAHTIAWFNAAAIHSGR